MILAAFVGAYGAIAGLGFSLTSGLLVGFVGSKGVWEVLFQRRWIIRSPSPYRIYVEDLESSGRAPRHPWIGYLGMMLLTGVLVGWLVYGSVVLLGRIGT